MTFEIVFFLYLWFITFINYILIKNNHKYLGNSNLFTICILSFCFSFLYTIYIYIKISSLKHKFERRRKSIEILTNTTQEENERIKKEKERKRQEYLKSPAIQEERKLVFENLLTIPGLSENIINCLFDQCPTKHAIINSSIEALAEVPGISNSLAKAIHARLRNT